MERLPWATQAMTLMLLWLAAPLLVAPWMRSRRIGGATAQLLTAGLVLAALWLGAATLDPAELRMIGQQSPGDAWFVGASIGFLTVGAGIIPAGWNPWRLVLALPLVGAAWLAVNHTMVVPLMVGGAIALAPFLAAHVLRMRPIRDRDRPAPSWRDHLTGVLAGISILALLVGPAIVAVLALLTLLWRGVWRGDRRVPDLVAVLVATILLAAWVVAAVTISGSLWLSLSRFAVDAPVSPAASQLLASLALAAMLCVIVPLARAPNGERASWLIPLAVATHFLVAIASPDGAGHWQPLLSTLMGVVCLLAVVRRRWTLGLAAGVVLVASRPGVLALITAMLIAGAPFIRRYLPDVRVHELGAGLVLVLAGWTVLRDQVLIGILLALVLMTTAYRINRRVATPTVPLHL